MRNALEDSVEEFLDQFRMARDAGDGQAYAALFTEDATYVIFLGEALIGRDEIERNQVDVFTRWQKGTKMRVKTIGVRSLSADVCSVATVGRIDRERPSPSTNSRR